MKEMGALFSFGFFSSSGASAGVSFPLIYLRPIPHSPRFPQRKKRKEIKKNVSKGFSGTAGDRRGNSLLSCQSGFFSCTRCARKSFFFLFRPAIVAVQLGSLINVFS